MPQRRKYTVLWRNQTLNPHLAGQERHVRDSEIIVKVIFNANKIILLEHMFGKRSGGMRL